jgi:hypothetical protein
VTPPVDVCPNMPGNQPVGTSCGGTPPVVTPPVTPPVDVCPTVPGLQQMGPCVTLGGGTPTVVPPVTPPAAGQPIGGVTPGQPATGPVHVGPPTGVTPNVRPNTAVPPAVLTGTTSTPATRPAAVRPSALPFTGTDAALLAELGALLLLAGLGVIVVARRERTARTAV